MMYIFKVKISFKKNNSQSILTRTISYYVVLLIVQLLCLFAIAGHCNLNVLVNRPKMIISIKYRLHIIVTHPPYNDSRSITATCKIYCHSLLHYKTHRGAGYMHNYNAVPKLSLHLDVSIYSFARFSLHKKALSTG